MEYDKRWEIRPKIEYRSHLLTGIFTNPKFQNLVEFKIYYTDKCGVSNMLGYIAISIIETTQFNQKSVAIFMTNIQKIYVPPVQIITTKRSLICRKRWFVLFHYIFILVNGICTPKVLYKNLYFVQRHPRWCLNEHYFNLRHWVLSRNRALRHYWNLISSWLRERFTTFPGTKVKSAGI